MEAEQAIGVAQEDLEGMTDRQLEDLLFVIDRTIESMDDQEGVNAYRMEAVDTSALQASYYKELDSLTLDLQTKKITLETFDKRIHDSINTNFTKAYEANRGAALDLGDKEYLKRATAEEMKYARKFGSDIADNTLAMPRQQRVDMYSKTLGGIGDHAKVEAAPIDSRFVWRLGEAEHCPDCIVLAANSPYTKATLPTTPRAGATVCLSNCRCNLIVQPGRLSKTQVAELKDLDMAKEQSLADMLLPPAPPKGMRLPDVKERKWIDNKRMQINTNRRRIATAPDKKALKKAIQARKTANAELNQFLESQSIYDVPIWSVDDVLEGRHIGASAIRDIMRHGIDGKSLGLLERKQLLSLLDEYSKATGQTLSTVTKIPNAPTVPKVPKPTPKPKPPKFDEKRTEELMDKLRDTGTLSEAEQLELREQLDNLFEKDARTNWSRASSDQQIPGMKIKTKSDNGVAGRYVPDADSIDLALGRIDDALQFLRGSRLDSAVKGMHTAVHEAVHAHSMLDLGAAYTNLGVIFEEAGADLLAGRIMVKRFGVKWSQIRSSMYYDKHISTLRGKIKKAFQAVSRKKKLNLNFDIEAVEKSIAHTFEKMLSVESGRLNKWQKYMAEFANNYEVPSYLLQGKSVKDVAAITKEFRKELHKVFQKWVIDRTGGKGFWYKTAIKV